MERKIALQVDHVTKVFPGVKALDDVTFEVAVGEVHGLVGENGAGKSTLMAVASGALVRHTSTIAFTPRAISAIVSSSRGAAPTLLVPASRTITFGWTPSSSPCSRRQRMFCVRSAPQPKSAAFHP